MTPFKLFCQVLVLYLLGGEVVWSAIVVTLPSYRNIRIQGPTKSTTTPSTTTAKPSTTTTTITTTTTLPSTTLTTTTEIETTTFPPDKIEDTSWSTTTEEVPVKTSSKVQELTTPSTTTAKEDVVETTTIPVDTTAASTTVEFFDTTIVDTTTRAPKETPVDTETSNEAPDSNIPESFLRLETTTEDARAETEPPETTTETFETTTDVLFNFFDSAGNFLLPEATSPSDSRFRGAKEGKSLEEGNFRNEDLSLPIPAHIPNLRGPFRVPRPANNFPPLQVVPIRNPLPRPVSTRTFTRTFPPSPPGTGTVLANRPTTSQSQDPPALFFHDPDRNPRPVNFRARANPFLIPLSVTGSGGEPRARTVPNVGTPSPLPLVFFNAPPPRNAFELELARGPPRARALRANPFLVQGEEGRRSQNEEDLTRVSRRVLSDTGEEFVYTLRR